jgi:hypothetical protein
MELDGDLMGPKASVWHHIATLHMYTYGGWKKSCTTKRMETLYIMGCLPPINWCRNSFIHSMSHTGYTGSCISETSQSDRMFVSRWERCWPSHSYMSLASSTFTYSMAMQQEPKLMVPTLYKAYVREYPHKIRPYMVQYLHFRILKFHEICIDLLCDGQIYSCWFGKWNMGTT